MSQVFTMSGMVTDDREAFLEDLRQGLKPRCEYCQKVLTGKRTNTRFCGSVCYSRNRGRKHKHGEAPAHCTHCDDTILSRRSGTKHCRVRCRIQDGRKVSHDGRTA